MRSASRRRHRIDIPWCTHVLREIHGTNESRGAFVACPWAEQARLTALSYHDEAVCLSGCNVDARARMTRANLNRMQRITDFDSTGAFLVGEGPGTLTPLAVRPIHVLRNLIVTIARL